MQVNLTNPKAIAQTGEQIYLHQFKKEYEEIHIGKFVAINVIAETASLGDTPEGALDAARAADPKGIFHLIRVGFPSAYQISYAIPQTSPDWLFE